MKSNVCKIEKGTKDLAAILKESEKVAVYNELTHKQSLWLRLLCEELDGMLPNVIGDFDGELWIARNSRLSGTRRKPADCSNALGPSLGTFFSWARLVKGPFSSR